MGSVKALLVDRDGTLIVEKSYLRDPDQVELIPGAVAAVKKAKEQGYLLLVLTNQSGVARGLMSLEDVDAVHQRILELGAPVDGFFICPHGPAHDCNCRKPRTGLADQAAEKFDLDLSQCVMVGDKSSDLELGIAIGARTILVTTGYGAMTAESYGKKVEILESLADLVV